MNNLKRVLSLALSGIMLVGMMAMGASAADFTDADKIVHDDAVNVLVSLNVINGQDDGSFNPEGDVTRGQMAKMIAVAMNGGKDTNTGVKGTPTFTDIKGHWAESYIEYCYDMGIISGRGDGTFDPDGKVTGLEATKMVLTALGYDSTAYRLTGGSWAVRTDELAKQASPKLYDELDNVVMANNATRDTAAQIIWNGLQNKTKRVTPSTNTSTGETTWTYGEGTADNLLEERYGAKIVIGTYAGNKDTGAGGEKGEIALRVQVASYDNNGNFTGYNTVTYNFPSDLGIENMGEEIKVIFKDGKDSLRTNIPDRKDTIFGVFNTGKTEVYHITRSDLQSCTKTNKIKFNDSEYDTLASIDVNYNYGVSTGTVTAATISSNAAGGWRQPNVDRIKFTCDTLGKIAGAYVVNVVPARVTGVTAKKVTLSSVGTFDIEGNNVYEGIAKDDVVFYTKYYAAQNDDALFTVTKAEAVEGKMTGFKKDNGKYINVVVDGTTYKVNDELTTLNSLTDDAVVTPGTTNAIGDTVRIFLADGKVVAVQSIEEAGGKYALITDVSNGGTIGSSIDPVRVTVLLPDGTKQNLSIHKDSTKAVTPNQPGTPITAQDVAVGALVEYTSISDGSIKIRTVAQSGTVTVPQATAGNPVVDGVKQVWNKDTKMLTYADGANGSLVASANAVLFVGRDTFADGQNGAFDGTINAKDSFDAYSVRDLGNISYTNSNTSQTASKTVKYYTKDGLVVAAYMILDARPSSSSADTLYGIVTAYTGTRDVNDETLEQYTVAVGRDDLVTVNVPAGQIATGDVVKFSEKTSTVYNSGDFEKLLLNTDAALGANKRLIVAVKDYNESAGILTYYTGTGRANTSQVFTGTPNTPTDGLSATVAKDVTIVYVNAKDNKQGDSIGVQGFNVMNGNANALICTDNDGVVDVIIVETGDVNFGGSNLFAVTNPQSAADVTASLGVNDTATISGNQQNTNLIPTTIPAGKTVIVDGDLTATTAGDADKVSRVVPVAATPANVNADKPAVTMKGGAVEYGFNVTSELQGKQSDSAALYKFDFSGCTGFTANTSTLKVGDGAAKVLDDGIFYLIVGNKTGAVTFEFDADGNGANAATSFTVTFPQW